MELKSVKNLIDRVYEWAGRPTRDGAKNLRDLAASVEHELGVSLSQQDMETEQFFNSTKNLRDLVLHLQRNMDVIGTVIDDKDRADLMELNLLTIRAFMYRIKQ